MLAMKVDLGQNVRLVVSMKVDLGQNIRLVVSLWRFIVSAHRFLLVDSLFSLWHSRLSPEKISERDVCVLPLIIVSEVTWLFQECVENDMIGSYIITRMACFWLVIIFAGFPRAVCGETTWIISTKTWHEFVRPLIIFPGRGGYDTGYSLFSEFDSANCQFDSPFSEVDSSLREFVSSSSQFDSSAGLFDSSFYEFDSSLTTKVRRRLSSCRFVVSSCRFIVSTRPLREAIIRCTLHEELLDSMHLYMKNI